MKELTYLLLVTNGLVLGLCAGFTMHRSDFCLAGIFRDLFIFRQVVMLRFLFLLVCVSILLFEAARLCGLIKTYPFPNFGPPSLTTVIGGIVFGIGMVLAGGCVVGTLYKMGAGSILSAVAFIGMIVGSVAYAEINVLWSTLRTATTFSKASTIPQSLGIDPFLLMLMFFAVSSYWCFRWYRAGKLVRASAAAGYLQPYKAAVILALVGLCSVILMGKPVGITTAYAKMGAYVESAVLKDHFQQLGKVKPQEYINPITRVRLPWSTEPGFDAVSLTQFPLIFGIIAGGALSALLLREFKVYYRVPPRQYVSAIIGGIGMGLASRMAPGCNVWHLLGGLPILAWQSLLFVAGMIPGAWLGSKLLVKVVVR